MFKKLLLVCTCLFVLSSCASRADLDYSIKTTKDIGAIAAAANTGHTSKDEALQAIEKVAEISTAKLDPENEILPTTTPEKIIDAEKTKPEGQPNSELIKVIRVASAGPASGSIGWGAIVGIGIAAAGILGKFMGPPFNVAGTLLQLVGSRLTPDYDRNKKVAAGVIVSVDQAFQQFNVLLESLDPKTRKALIASLNGKTPEEWFKSKLNRLHQDLGVHDDVDSMICQLKRECTTKDGVLHPAVNEFERFITKKA